MTLSKADPSLQKAPLGQKSKYVNQYAPSLLFPIPRKIKREEIGITGHLPFSGLDLWTGYEVSWLNLKGKPVVAVAEFRIPCESPHIIESKSFKLYLNSFNGSRFESFEHVAEIFKKDLSQAAGAQIFVRVISLKDVDKQAATFSGVCIDDLDVTCDTYMPNPGFLKVVEALQEIQETVYTDLLKSNCLVTGQPDWGSVQINYRGRKIDSEGLLKYVVSLRDHNEFHEQCVERIFSDILRECRPKMLTVYARYTRRGGLDINPLRTNDPEGMVNVDNNRLMRQ